MNPQDSRPFDAFLASDRWIVGSLDRWIVGSLDRWIVGSLDRWIVSIVVEFKKSSQNGAADEFSLTTSKPVSETGVLTLPEIFPPLRSSAMEFPKGFFVSASQLISAAIPNRFRPLFHRPGLPHDS